MKKIKDKPSKVTIQYLAVLFCIVTTLRGDAIYKEQKLEVQGPPKITQEIALVETPATIQEELVVDTPVERLPVEPQIKKGVLLSRGGYIAIKPPTQREMITMYVRDVCKKYDMEPELIMSVIQQESNYNPKAANGNCLGLMQVSSYWHQDRAERLGVTDFYDAYSNILLGVDYLSELRDQYKDMRLVLMLYNMEHKTAFRLYNNGEISNYATTILARAEEFKKGE
jgi:hypothetical protein